jgi:hypothetical protein
MLALLLDALPTTKKVDGTVNGDDDGDGDDEKMQEEDADVVDAGVLERVRVALCQRSTDRIAGGR